MEKFRGFNIWKDSSSLSALTHTPPKQSSPCVRRAPYTNSIFASRCVLLPFPRKGPGSIKLSLLLSRSRLRRSRNSRENIRHLRKHTHARTLEAHWESRNLLHLRMEFVDKFKGHFSYGIEIVVFKPPPIGYSEWLLWTTLPIPSLVHVLHLGKGRTLIDERLRGGE